LGSILVEHDKVIPASALKFDIALGVDDTSDIATDLVISLGGVSRPHRLRGGLCYLLRLRSKVSVNSRPEVLESLLSPHILESSLAESSTVESRCRHGSTLLKKRGK